MSGTTPEPDSGREKQTTQGTWRVRYAPNPDPIPFNQVFTMTVDVLGSSGGAAAEVTELGIAATMPSHGHGMETTPVVTRTGDGVFRVDGMQFHMSGVWEVKLDPRSAATTENTVFNIECCGE